jgi:single-strand DNA-binding protein
MSMTLAGLARLGNDPTVRRMADNKAVMDLSLAFSFGRKVDGKQPVTWISATMWGDRCDKLKPYLVKGQLLVCHLDRNPYRGIQTEGWHPRHLPAG